MLRHRGLYKEQSMALTPFNHNARNRELQKETRANQRNKCFQNNRMISLSPTPSKPAIAVAPSAKENQQAHLESESENQRDATSTTLIQKKFTRQELYLQRFMKWKDNCKQKYQQIKPRIGQTVQSKAGKDAPPQAPFLKSSETFQPPANLQQQNANPSSLVSRRSLYLVIEPTKQEIQAKLTKPNGGAEVAAGGRNKPIRTQPAKVKASPVIPNIPKLKPQISTVSTIRPHSSTIKPQLSATKTKQSAAKPQTSAGRLARIPTNKPTTTPLSSLSSQLTVTKSAPKLPNLMVEPFSKPVYNKPMPTKPIRKVGKAQILKPQPIRGGSGAVAGGAAGKFKTKPDSKSSHLMRANLSTRMKPKVAGPAKHTKVILNEILKSTDVVTAAAPQTPLDNHNFHTQVTSTQCRSNNNSSANLMDAFSCALEEISPVVPVLSNNKINSVSGRDSKVKRQLLAQVVDHDFVDIEPEVGKVPVVENNAEQEKQRKYNFMQCESMIESPSADSVTIIGAPVNEDTLKPQLQEEKQQTPPRRSSICNTSNNYLSPYVTCSRGKVNSRNEKEKRTSMYLKDPETPLEVRLALESVNYFRQQLAQEIERLHGLCQEWEEYCKLHEARLLETDCLDMINVAIGQTKLLTSKKMMQFRGLIDRCEAGAKGCNTGPNDGSEDSKPVLPKDLEGWWDLLKLGSDNLDKRFGSLNKWRDNDWMDPDARKEIKPKTNLAKTLKAKPKAKASSSLKQFLLNAKLKHKKQLEEAKTDQDSTLTAGDQGTPTSRRSQRVIVVRDRKSFSPARTVLRLSRSGESPRSSVCAPTAGGNQLLKSAIMAATLQRTPPPPPSMKSRTSILKTPGTAKREAACRGVIFSAKKKVRRFQFTVDEEGELDKTGGVDKLEDCEEDMSIEEPTLQEGISNDKLSENGNNATNTSRTYTLRNRKVKLRPSSEFMYN